MAAVNSILQVENLTKSFGDLVLFENISFGLSEGRFIVLFLLDSVPRGVAPNKLAEQAGVTPATMTGLIDGLERDNLVNRQADPDDRRRPR